MRRGWPGLAALAWAPLLAASGLPAQDPDSVIYLTKNTNRNQVHYGVHVDAQCRPLARKPVYAYWRMLEEGDDARATLMFWEQPGYGVKQPRDISREDDSGSFEFTIRGVPERRLRLETFAVDGACRARAYTRIAEQDALFQRIDIRVSGWANVHRVEIFGVGLENGLPVSEITHLDAAESGE